MICVLNASVNFVIGITLFQLVISVLFFSVDSTRDVIKKAAIAVGSLKETGMFYNFNSFAFKFFFILLFKMMNSYFHIAEFDIRFNPDVFSPGVKHPNPQVSKLIQRIYINTYLICNKLNM